MSELYVARHLWIVSGKDGLNYPQSTFRQSPKVEVLPDVDTPYPPIPEYLAGTLTIVPDKDSLQYPMEFTFRQPPKQELVFWVNTPYPQISDLPGKQLSVTFDGYTVADRLYVVAALRQEETLRWWITPAARPPRVPRYAPTPVG